MRKNHISNFCWIQSRSCSRLVFFFSSALEWLELVPEIPSLHLVVSATNADDESKDTHVPFIRNPWIETRMTAAIACWKIINSDHGHSCQSFFQSLLDSSQVRFASNILRLSEGDNRYNESAFRWIIDIHEAIGTLLQVLEFPIANRFSQSFNVVRSIPKGLYLHLIFM